MTRCQIRFLIAFLLHRILDLLCFVLVDLDFGAKEEIVREKQGQLLFGDQVIDFVSPLYFHIRQGLGLLGTAASLRCRLRLVIDFESFVTRALSLSFEALQLLSRSARGDFLAGDTELRFNFAA